MRGHRRFSQSAFRGIWRPAAVAVMFGAAALMVANPAAAKSKKEETFTVHAAISLPNGKKVQSFDIGFVDPMRTEYYLADRTNAQVDVVNTSTNQVIATLTANFAGAGPTSDTSGPNGVLTVAHQFLWIGDFGNGSNSNGVIGGLVKVYDLDAGALVKTISTGGVARADELCFDPKDNLILVANDAEPLPPAGPGPYMTFIDSDTFQIKGTIPLGGQNTVNGVVLKATNGVEQCQWDGRTKVFYLAIPELNGPGDDSAAGAVLVIDPSSMKVTDVFPVDHTVCKGPQGMAIGPRPQILLGCNNPGKHEVPSTITINERNGNVFTVFPNQDGSDEVWFNPGDSHYFLGESGGANPQHLGILDALTARGETIGVSDKSPKTGIAGGGGSHSVAADPRTGKVFVPIAANAGAGVCGSVGGNESAGCIAVYKANRGTDEGQ